MAGSLDILIMIENYFYYNTSKFFLGIAKVQEFQKIE